MTGPANRLEPPDEDPGLMRPLPPGGIETTESHRDPVEMSASDTSDAPVVGYTVKELIARMEGKLDAYAKRQDAINENVTRLVPQVDDHEKRLKVLELKDLAKGAVVAWRVTFWKIGVAVLGAGTSFAVIWEAFHR
jgi:hypothetical protein